MPRSARARAFVLLALATADAVEFPAGFSISAFGGASLPGSFELQSTYIGKHTLSSQSHAQGWSSLSVDRSVPGEVAVHASTDSFTLNRRYIAADPGRVLVNDTIKCTASSQCALYTNHTILLHAASPVVQLNGAFNAPQLSECSTNIVRGMNGNPSVVASSAAGGGLGVMLLDDVSRAHAYMENRATPTRIPGHAPCAISDPPAFDVVDPYLALRPGHTFTAEWALYVIEPSVATDEVPWAFANRLRRDLGVNGITLQGGGTLASWETEILKAGNWTDGGGCSMNSSVHLQGAVCWPTWPDATLEAFLAYQGTQRVVSNIMRMETPWRKCEDNHTTRDYCYGSCGTARQYSNWTAVYMRRLVASLRRIHYRGKALLYLHPFISTEHDAATLYPDDQQLTSDGTPVCDYAYEFVGTLGSKYGQALLDFVPLAMDVLGFDGIYLDESSYGATPLDFSPKHDDGHSAIIDPETFRITRHVSFVPLTYQGLQGALFDAVTRRGGVLVANSYPVTRSMTQSSIRNQVVHFCETSAKGREIWGWASTPVGLAKALFQSGDPDPRYAHVSGLPVDNLWADLDFGTLTYMYDMTLPNVTGWERPRPNVMQHLFPLTPSELGPGWIVGSERIVSKASRKFTFAGAAQSLRLRYFDRQGWQTSTSVVKGPSVDVQTDGGGARSFATVTSAALRPAR